SHYSFSHFVYHQTAPPDISTLSLHDALPICPRRGARLAGLPRHHGERDLPGLRARRDGRRHAVDQGGADIGHRDLRALLQAPGRSEEHTSELQSLAYLVCRLLLEKKKKI